MWLKWYLIKLSDTYGNEFHKMYFEALIRP